MVVVIETWVDGVVLVLVDTSRRGGCGGGGGG